MKNFFEALWLLAFPVKGKWREVVPLLVVWLGIAIFLGFSLYWTCAIAALIWWGYKFWVVVWREDGTGCMSVMVEFFLFSTIFTLWGIWELVR